MILGVSSLTDNLRIVADGLPSISVRKVSGIRERIRLDQYFLIKLLSPLKKWLNYRCAVQT